MKHFKFMLLSLLSSAVLLSLFCIPSRAESLPMPFKEHPVGSYFTKNGKNCTCHQIADCISSKSDCNCLRYYTYKGKTYDLLGVQCIGFARMCQLRLFGYIDYGQTKDKYINIVGKKLLGGAYTKDEIKKYISSSPMGSHMRIGGHSIIILSANEKYFTTYECNSSVKGRECRIFTRTFTYESFFNEYGESDLHYINFPKEIEKTESLTTSAPPSITTTKVNITSTKPQITSARPIQTSVVTTAKAPYTEVQITTKIPQQSEPAVFQDIMKIKIYRTKRVFERSVFSKCKL